jgi:hypothetical protein
MTSNVLEFFNSRDVKNKITKRTLTEARFFGYLFLVLTFDIYAYLQCKAVYLGNIKVFDSSVNLWAIYLFYVALGVVVFFIANMGFKGKNFLEKYFSYAFTIGIKYFVIFLILLALPKYIHVDNVLTYQLYVFYLLNNLMTLHIAYQIYITR